MPPQNIKIPHPFRLNAPWFLWGLLGMFGVLLVVKVYPVYTIQHIAISYIIGTFFIALIKKRVYQPPTRILSRGMDVRGRDAIYLSLMFLVIATIWGVCSGYFSFTYLKYDLISLGVMLMYVYVLTALLYRVGDYYQELQRQYILETETKS
jgi:hypothetical protein